MFDEAKSEALKQAEELNDKIDKAVDAKIEQLQAAVDDIQARLAQAKASRFTWAIVAGAALALLSLGALVVLR